MGHAHLTVSFGDRPNGSPDPVLQFHILDEGVSFWEREERLLFLSEVELDGTVLHQDVGDESAPSQLLARNTKRHVQPLAVFGESHLHLFVVFKVLDKREGHCCAVLLLFGTKTSNRYLPHSNPGHRFHQTSRRSPQICSLKTFSQFLRIHKRKALHLFKKNPEKT